VVVSLFTFEEEVRLICEEVEKLLITKNKKYGNSALQPKRIFSTANAVEQIFVRIDDKLSRIANQSPSEDEDVIMDLLGYLVLLRIAQKQQSEDLDNFHVV
jgi:hypothetical protein